MRKESVSVLYKAIEFYEKLGYTFIDLEWTVPKVYSDVTKPPLKRDFCVDGEVLVGSGEQSFIKKMVEGALKPDVKYMGITPCFRDDELDELHNRYFLKLELFCVSETTIHEELLKDAHSFFVDVLDKDVELKHISSNSLDLVLCGSGIELGSYIKHSTSINNTVYVWSCGTGVALPRIFVK